MIVSGNDLHRGHTRSCGCLRVENMQTHGMSKTYGYRAWDGMKQRCTNQNAEFYPFYGGRGIKVCDRWLHSFDNFLKDMGMPDAGKTIERIDNNGNYEPGNCKWASRTEQMNNTRHNRKIMVHGETKNLRQWAKIVRIDENTITERINRGWNEEDAVTTPLMPQGRRRV